MTPHIQSIEQDLNSFNLQTRREALSQLQKAIAQGKITAPEPQPICNLHAHSFFSYNAYGYSPSMLAWLAKKEGIPLMGIIDFDTLDGVEEFLTASEVLGVCGTASLETRVHLPEFSEDVINSPREPGVIYHTLAGFAGQDLPPEGELILVDLKQRSSRRNRRIVSLLNDYLYPVEIDYQETIVPLSAGGMPTERHILSAYISAVEEQVPEPILFWADKLDLTTEKIQDVIQNKPAFKRLVREMLIKAGGVAYQKPDEGSFPPLAIIHELARAGNALPTAVWLDGTHTGEQREPELLAFLIAQGVVALNIIPERNINAEDPKEKALKIQNLYDVVALSRSMDLPIIIGTEMNKSGQKIVNDFYAAPLAPLQQVFLDGGYFLYGHTVMSRHAGLGYPSNWANQQLETRAKKNDFFTLVGKLVPPTPEGRQKIQELPHDPSPRDVISYLSS
jgi:hypothetical protein